MTKILMRREGNSICFYRDDPESFKCLVAQLFDDKDFIIFDPIGDLDAVHKGTPAIDAAVFDAMGLTVEMARMIDLSARNCTR